MTSGLGTPAGRPAGQNVTDPEGALAPGGPVRLRADAPNGRSDTGGGAPDSTAEVARQQAGEVADTAGQAGAQVVQSAKEQIGEVTQEAGRQARDLLDQVRSEATDQAATQQQRAAGGLRSLADELSGMAANSDQDGPATDLARQAAGRLHDVARWLEDRDPGSVLDEVRAFARRRPGAYLAIAAGAGVLAGRLTRGLASHDETSGHPDSGRSAVRPPDTSLGRSFGTGDAVGGGIPPTTPPPGASSIPAAPPPVARPTVAPPAGVGVSDEPAWTVPGASVPGPTVTGGPGDIRR